MTMRRFALFVMVPASVSKIILMGCLTTPIREPANSPTSTSLSSSARTVITVLYVFCPDCGKQILRYRTLCDCDAVVQRRQQEENRKEKERLEKAEKHEPNALGSLFAMAQSDFYSHNEGYFSCWEDFFDSWNEDREEFTEKPLYVWGTEEVEMSFDASSIVSNACEDMYEDAYDDIGADAVAEMQRYLNEWKEKYGRTSYLLTTKHAIRIPWEEMK